MPLILILLRFIHLSLRKCGDFSLKLFSKSHITDLPIPKIPPNWPHFKCLQAPFDKETMLKKQFRKKEQYNENASIVGFKRHHRRLVSALTDAQADAIIMVRGRGDGGRAKSFSEWYVGLDCQEVVFAVTPKRILILADVGVAQSLEFINEIKHFSKHTVTFLKRSSRHGSNEDQVKYIFDCIRRGKRSTTLTVAIPDDSQKGDLQQEITQYLKQHENEVRTVDADDILVAAMQIKDRSEMERVKIAGALASFIMKKLIGWVEQSIDKQDKIRHIQLSKRMEQFMQDTSELQIIEQHCQPKGPFQLAYPPVIQSGGLYDLTGGVVISTHDLLKPDCIIVQLGVKHQGYHANCIRTLLITPDAEARVVYTSLLTSFQHLVEKLKPGVKLSRLYRSVQNHWIGSIEKEHHAKFPACIGWGIGLEQREEQLRIEAASKIQVEEGMCFAIRIAIEGLAYGEREGKPYAMCLCDTVCVANSYDNMVVTSAVEKSFKRISLHTAEDGLETNPNSQFLRYRREATIQDQTQLFLVDQVKHSQSYFQEMQRKMIDLNQEYLKEQKQFELEERVYGKYFYNPNNYQRVVMKDILSYKPYQPKPTLITGRFFIDTQAHTVLVPFKGGHIPFHALTIKSVTVEQAQKREMKAIKEEHGVQPKLRHKLKLTFWTSETTIFSRIFPPTGPGEVFIKELTFSSHCIERLEDYALLIGELQKHSRQKEKEFVKEPIPDLITQPPLLILEPLVLCPNNTKPLSVGMVRVRPQMNFCKSTDGTLEMHVNGFRYVSQKEEIMDITFASVKHFIYQSPEEEIIAAIHLQLKGPIMVNKKRTSEVQFYREVPGALESLENKFKFRLTSMDIEFERGVKQERIDMIREFEEFISKVEDADGEFVVKFERPLRHMAYEGNWNRARLFLQPSQNCVLNVVESPFFIVTISDVDICCFERVMVGVKTFDIVFVYKSYEKGWVRVESIERDYLDQILAWLNSKNILCFSVSSSLMWKNMLFTIMRDFRAFVHEGGWTKLMSEQVDHAPLHNYQDDGSSVYEPPSSEAETSFSIDIPELADEPPEPGNVIYEEDSISDIAHSSDILDLQQTLDEHSDPENYFKKPKKKIRESESM